LNWWPFPSIERSILALDRDAAFAELEDGAGTRYDGAVVAACRRAFDAGFRFGG
jgi:hypothetical protein